MERGENLDSIPIDLIVEILSRLPAKSIGRFRSVSKLWGSILHRSYFTKLFLTKSRARPRLLIFIKPVDNGAWQLYSVPQPQVPYEKSSSSIVVRADFHMKFPLDQINFSCTWTRPFSCDYASGYICFSNIRFSNGYDNMPVICNPSTGQYAIIPNLTRSRISSEFLGFDPIDKQFKLLSMGHPNNDDEVEHRILTLGTGELIWRKIQCPFHEDWGAGICINGVLYYTAGIFDDLIIVCFDVRCEEFDFIPAGFFNFYCTTLINYKGKLGGISWNEDEDDAGAIKLTMWVLEDVENKKWSKHVYTVSDSNIVEPHHVSVAGMTSTCEIVLCMEYASKPFYVFYFNPERNTLQTVEIQGNHQVFDSWKLVYIFVDHVEDLNFNIMNTTSISPPEQKRKPVSTSTSSIEDHNQQQEHHQEQDRLTFESNNKPSISIRPPEQKRRPTSTSTSSKQDNHQKQDHRTFESINKFDALCLLDDDMGETECDSSFTDHVEDLTFNITKTTSISPPVKKRR